MPCTASNLLSFFQFLNPTLNFNRNSILDTQRSLQRESAGLPVLLVFVEKRLVPPDLNEVDQCDPLGIGFVWFICDLHYQLSCPRREPYFILSLIPAA